MADVVFIEAASMLPEFDRPGTVLVAEEVLEVDNAAFGGAAHHLDYLGHGHVRCENHLASPGE